MSSFRIRPAHVTLSLTRGPAALAGEAKTCALTGRKAINAALKSVCVAGTIMGALCLSSAQSFIGLGPAPGLTSNAPYQISRNGITLLGSGSAAGFGDDWIWSAGSQTFAVLPGNTNTQPYDYEHATNVSDDGSTIVGTEYGSYLDTLGYHVFQHGFAAGPSGTKTNAFVWHDASGNDLNVTADAVSSDGTVVFGTVDFGDHIESFMWTAASSSMQLLPFPLTGYQTSSRMYPVASASSGYSVFGYSTSQSGTGVQAFRYVPSIGLLQPLGTWTPGQCSIDGQVVVGIATEQNSFSVIYNCANGTTTDGPYQCTNIGISPDGSTAYGTYTNADDTSHGFLQDVATGAPTDLGSGSRLSAGSNGRFAGSGFDAQGHFHYGFYQLGYGWVDLTTAFQSYGLAEGWGISLQGFSSDGSILYGYGFGPGEVQPEPWYANVPNAPPAQDDLYYGSVNTTMSVSAPGVLANDGNAHGAMAILVSGPSNGSLTLNQDGSFTYTPNPNFEGTDTFIYDEGGTNAAVTIITNDVLYSASANPAEVAAGADSVITVTLGGPAPAGGATLLLNANNATLDSNQAVVAQGQTQVTFNAHAVQVSQTTVATVTATYNGGHVAATFTIQPVATAMNDLYYGSVNTTMNIAPPGVLANDTNASGAIAVLVSGTSNGSLTLNQDGSFSYIPNSMFEGTDTFTYKDTINGIAGNVATVTIITNDVLYSATANPATVIAGQDSVITVTLGGPAPSGGASIQLSAQNTTLGSAQVVIPQGQTQTTLHAYTAQVSQTTVAMVTATYNGGSVSASFTIQPLVVSALTLSPAIVTGGNSSQGKLTIDGPAPNGGAVVAISSDNSAAKTPASVTIQAGATSATFVVTTTSVATAQTARIYGSLNGLNSSGALTVKPAQLLGLAFSPSSVKHGQTTVLTVSLTGLAPTGGASVSLASNNTSAVMVPLTITIPAGSKSASLSIVTGSKKATVTVTATYLGVNKGSSVTVS